MDKNSIIEILKKYNPWDPDDLKKTLKLGLRREKYLSFIKKSLGNNLIKVLVGQRRSGKSYILKQFYADLLKEYDSTNLLYINFELKDFSFIKDSEILNQVVELYLKEIKKDLNSKTFLFFDEIQEVKEWEKTINSFLADPNFEKEIFITGSNSKLLSSELATYLTGRFISKTIYPFSFYEFTKYFNLKPDRESFLRFLGESQLPEIYSITDDEFKYNYIHNLKDSILYTDVAKRHGVQNLDLLEKIFLFLVDNIANPFSLNSIAKKLKSEGNESNLSTIATYIKYLEESFVLIGVSRYDIKGKAILEGEKKYYLNDFGFKKYLLSSFDPAQGKVLENYVYNAIRACDFKVHVGKIGNYEVDFIAEKYNKKIYIQSTYLLSDESVIEREFGNLQKIPDNWPKIVVSLDDFYKGTFEGIEHIQAWDLEKRLQSY